jgi:hypothetical protein
MPASTRSAFSEELWNMVVCHVQSASHDFAIWTARLSDGERVVGLCVFALTIVMIFSFGAGWLFEDKAGVSEFVSTLF